MENIPSRQMPIQISNEEIEIINDIRRVDFGRVTLCIQNGVIISKEVTIVKKFCKCKNNNGNVGNNSDKAKAAPGISL